MKSRFLALIIVVLVLSVVTTGQTIFQTHTGLSGFWDFQTYSRTPQYLRACPGSSSIHAVMMISEDLLEWDASRRTAYAYSSNGGNSWNTFSNVRIPGIRSGYPALDLGLGPISCTPIIANHSTGSFVYTDDPPGQGAFAEISLPPHGSDALILPEIAGTADGSIFLMATGQTTGTIYYSRILDSVAWTPFGEIPGSYGSAGGYVAEANSRGRVGVALSGQLGLSWFESTDNGMTWPALPVVLLPPTFTVGSDTFFMSDGVDLVYTGDDTLITFGVAELGSGEPSTRNGIGFWSEATGFVLAVPHDSVPGAVDSLRRPQERQTTVGMPAIGLSGSTIVIAFQAFTPETSAAGFNYADIFFTFSTDDGSHWSSPCNLTNTQSLDERYVSMSKWNAAGQANMAWQEDPQPGSAVFNDYSPFATVRQAFCRFADFLTTVDEQDHGTPTEFFLDQNYPNPFNPSTTIRFNLPHATSVSLRVYDLLGREVAILVSGNLHAGLHPISWNADGLANGVYFYRLQSPTFVTTKAMLFLK
jgi:hypothetical protein